MRSETLDDLLRRVILEAKARLHPSPPSLSPSPEGVWLSAAEADLLLAAASTTLKWLQETS